MSALNILKSDLDYGRKILHSGLEGARSGREAFLHGRSLTPFLREALVSAFVPAASGAFLGAWGTYPRGRDRFARRAIGWSLLGAAVGLCAGAAFASRRLTASVAEGAWKSIGRVRDEHWLEKNPIDYA
jgi:hypothetical protein